MPHLMNQLAHIVTILESHLQAPLWRGVLKHFKPGTTQNICSFIRVQRLHECNQSKTFDWEIKMLEEQGKELWFNTGFKRTGEKLAYGSLYQIHKNEQYTHMWWKVHPSATQDRCDIRGLISVDVLHSAMLSLQSVYLIHVSS